MKPNYKKISILRSPDENFISSWRFYSDIFPDMRKMLPMYSFKQKELPADDDDTDYMKEIEEFLQNPLHYLRSFKYDSPAYFFTFQPQFLFFGYPR